MKVDIPAFAQARVLVVGDVMLDRYWQGPTQRISPEAPVPVVKHQHSEDRLGGAANVALNCQALGANATVCARNNDRATVWCDVMALKRHYAKHGGISSCTNRHCLLGGNCCRAFDQPVTINPCFLRIATMSVFNNICVGQVRFNIDNRCFI